jgi:FkbM family methyltransferase
VLSAMAMAVKRLLRVLGLDVSVNSSRIWGLEFLRGFGINTVFDIGANDGRLAQEISRILPSSKIYCFEPLAAQFNELEKKSAKTGQIVAFNVALGEFNGEGQINQNEFSPSSSFFEPTELAQSLYPFTSKYTPTSTKVFRLDDFVLKKSLAIVPNVMVKIDVQGYEDRVIRGATRVLSTAVIAVVEVCYVRLYSNQQLFDGIYALLRELGLVYAGSMNYVKNPSTGLPVFSDGIFIRKEAYNQESALPEPKR